MQTGDQMWVGHCQKRPKNLHVFVGYPTPGRVVGEQPWRVWLKTTTPVVFILVGESGNGNEWDIHLNGSFIPDLDRLLRFFKYTSYGSKTARDGSVDKLLATNNPYNLPAEQLVRTRKIY